MNNDIFMAAFFDEMEKQAVLVHPWVSKTIKRIATKPFRMVGNVEYGPRVPTPYHVAGQVIGKKRTWYGGEKDRLARGYSRMTVGRKARSVAHKAAHPIQTLKIRRKTKRRAGRAERSVTRLEGELTREQPRYLEASERLKKFKETWPEADVKKMDPGRKVGSKVKIGKDKDGKDIIHTITAKEILAGPDTKSKVELLKGKIKVRMEKYENIDSDVTDLTKRHTAYTQRAGKAIKPSRVKAFRRKVRKVLGLKKRTATKPVSRPTSALTGTGPAVSAPAVSAGYTGTPSNPVPTQSEHAAVGAA